MVEVKSFNKPPRQVTLVLEAVCILLDEEETTWKHAKKMLNRNYEILDRMKDFDKDDITPQTIERLQPYLANADFDVEGLKRISTAASAFCCWVRGTLAYHDI